MRKGDIVLIPFPFTDLSGKKVRPALVLHTSAKGEDFIAAFMSSVAKGKPSVYEIAIVPSKENGIKAASHLKLDKLATLQKKLAIGEIGTLEAVTLRRVEATLRTLFRL